MMTVADLQKAPPPPDNLPEWVKDEVVATQHVNDVQYINGPGGVNNFIDQAAAYVQTQGIKRGSDRTYIADPFPMKIPVRMLVSADDMGATTLTPAPDLSIKLSMPYLPPLPPPTDPGISFGGAHPPASLDEVPQRVKNCEAMLKAICSRFGVTWEA